VRRAAIVLAFLVVASLLQAQDTERRKGFSVTLTEPLNQDVVFGKTKIAAKVDIDDPALVDRVEFMVNEEVVFVDREPPYEYFHDFGESARSWIIRVVAWHVEGVSVSDVSVTRKLEFSNIEHVDRVLLWISATDKNDEFVTDLDRSDLRLFENDTPQEIIDFYAEQREITLAFIIDASGSMRDKIDQVHLAAGAFVDTLRDIDKALVIDFDDNVFLTQDLTSDHAALKQAIQSTEPLGATSLYDALHAAYRKIGKIEGRKAMLLLSDGEDTSSRLGYKRVLEEAKSNNTMLYTIGIEGDGTFDRGVLKELAEVTGGKAFVVKKAEELGGVYQKIAAELGRQYYVSYSTTNKTWDGHWVGIRVDPLRKDVKIRARRGYFAVRTSG
jgi:Ca-activated chloride channel homolog